MEKFTQEDWEEFKEGKLGVNCKSEQDATLFLDEVVKNNVTKWVDNETLHSYRQFFYLNGENTVYALEFDRLFIFDIDDPYEHNEYEVKMYECKPNIIIDSNQTIPEGITTGVMIDMLLNNPERKAYISHNILFVAKPEENTIIVDEHDNFVWENSKQILKINSYQKNNLWTIIEPIKQLKKMSFAEAFDLYLQNETIVDSEGFEYTYNNTNSWNFNNRKPSKSILMSDWYVKGVYEDEN